MNRKCAKCGAEKPLNEFKRDKKGSAGHGYYCNPCARSIAKAYYHSRPASKKAEYLSAKQRATIRNQIWICEYLKVHSCIDCGEEDIETLEFDHLPKYKKDNDLCALIRGGYSIKSLEQEIKKCEVVCANCHRKRTNRRGNNYRLRFIQNNLIPL